MKKRLFSLLLVTALCAGLLAVPAEAGNTAQVGGGHNHRFSSSGDIDAFAHYAVIDDNGSLWTWGYNSCGQLGNGTTENSQVPIKIMDNVVSVHCSGSNTAAIDVNGALWTWGNFGPLVGNDTLDPYVPTPAKVLENSVVDVSMGGGFAMALSKFGGIWTWGTDIYAQGISWSNQDIFDYYQGGFLDHLEHDDDDSWWEDVNAPMARRTSNVAAIAAGGGTAFYLYQDGVLTAQGSNALGLVGRTFDYDEWVESRDRSQIKLLTDVASVNAGSYNAAAILTNGDLYAWGDTLYNQLGDHTLPESLEPYYDAIDVCYKVQHTPLKMAENIAAVSCGSDRSIGVIRTDGTLWRYGATWDAADEPVYVADNVVALDCGGKMFQKADGSIWWIKDDGSLSKFSFSSGFSDSVPGNSQPTTNPVITPEPTPQPTPQPTPEPQPEGQVTAEGIRVLAEKCDFDWDNSAAFDVTFTNTTDHPIQGSYCLVSYEPAIWRQIDKSTITGQLLREPTEDVVQQFMFFDLDLAPGESLKKEKIGVQSPACMFASMLWVKFDSLEEKEAFIANSPLWEGNSNCYVIHGNETAKQFFLDNFGITFLPPVDHVTYLDIIE